MVKAVLWDVDDTLFDHEGADRRAFALHFAAEGLACDEVALAAWREVTDAAYARFSAGELTFTGQRRVRARTYLGAGVSDEEADAWYARYVGHFEGAWAAFPDAAPALAGLVSYRHGILSNSDTPLQERKLTYLGLRHHFEFVLCSEQVGHAKPDARAFHAACREFGLAPGEIAYVGDRLDLDGLGARDAGLHGIWLDRSGGAGVAPEGVHRIGGLPELAELLRAL